METTNLDNIKNKKVLVVGFGKSGQALLKEFIALGAKVSLQDSRSEEEIEVSLLSLYRDKGVTFYLGTAPEDMESYDMIVLSPGVSPEIDFVEEAASKGVEITGELEVAYRICRGTFIAITGTNGKTTTTTLTGEIFRKAGEKTFVVGNIGNVAISHAREAEEDAFMVTEASSFQLETTKYFKPKVSAILNITPDHLNRHHTMEGYANAKAKIFANQNGNDYLVTNKDDEICVDLAKRAKAKVLFFSIREELDEGAFLKGDELILKEHDGKEHVLAKREELRIIGDHNVQNVLAASLIARSAGVSLDVIEKAVKDFRGVEHRIEYVAVVDGVKYYNDSKGTNTDATFTAIKALEDDIILIAGGDAKEQDFSGLVKEFVGRVKKVILLGRDGHMIKEAMMDEDLTNYIECKGMDECVRKAHEIAEPGDKVLLSPACASWDMYDNYEQRGRHFKDLVKSL